MRETAASLALLPDTPHGGAARALGAHRAGDRGRAAAAAGREPPPLRRRARRAPRGARAPGARAGRCRSRPRRRSRSWCSPCRSCRCTASSTRAHQVGREGDRGRVRRAGERCRAHARSGLESGIGRDARPGRAAARRHRLPPRRPPRPALVEPDVPAVGADRERATPDRRVGRGARPGSDGGRVPRQRPGPRVRGHGRALRAGS